MNHWLDQVEIVGIYSVPQVEKLLFQGCLIQNGKLRPTFVQNILWDISVCWIDILTSNLVCG